MIRFIANPRIRLKRITELIQSPAGADSHHDENKCPMSQVHEDKNCKLMHVFHAMSESGVGLSLRAGALFTSLSLWLFFFIMAKAWTGYVDLVSIIVLTTATTYLVGGELPSGETKGKACCQSLLLTCSHLFFLQLFSCSIFIHTLQILAISIRRVAMTS